MLHTSQKKHECNHFCVFSCVPSFILCRYCSDCFSQILSYFLCGPFRTIKWGKTRFFLNPHNLLITTAFKEISTFGLPKDRWFIGEKQTGVSDKLLHTAYLVAWWSRYKAGLIVSKFSLRLKTLICDLPSRGFCCRSFLGVKKALAVSWPGERSWKKGKKEKKSQVVVFQLLN